MANTGAPRKHDDYTVGMVCPMGMELVAVKAMLDDTHPALPSSCRDMINYTLGHIGGHNVVIAILPETGNNRAAQVALQLLNDFAQIRFGLLVGIGGGVPSDDHDIRLGDVVVSKPSGEHGGVVQYDMGKFRTSGRFERTGTLKKPPTLLLTTIGNLQAEYLQRGSSVATYLEEMHKRWPAMKSNGFIFPGAEYDQLFEPTYDHPGGATCQKCSKDEIVDRFSRYDNNPKVFYGTIGSGNAVIKDAKIRERLREDLGILCVEMEAAGLMDEFQCLVIRGICDYADSHKNKIWQPYAAATAAAYIKELLLALPVKQTESILKAEKALHPQYTNEIWTVPFSPPPVYVGRSGIYNHMKESCFNDSDRETTGNRVFVLYGLAGSGKTSLCVKFAWEFREKFWAVFWIHANSDTSVQMSLQEVGKTYSPEKYDDYRLAVRWLSNLHMPWLLIYDNADDPNLDLSFYLPASDRGLVIITSRNPNSVINSTLGSHILGEMQEHEACDLLLRLVGRQGDATEALAVVRAVGCLALPIIHAAAYLRKGLCTMKEYPEKLARKRSAVLNYQKDQGAASYPLDTYASLELSATHIQSWAKTNPVAAHALQLLEIIAFWHFESISEEIFEYSYIGVNKNLFSASPLEMRLLSFLGANPARFASVPPEKDQMPFVPFYGGPESGYLDDVALSSPTENTPRDSARRQHPQEWDNQAIRETFALLSSYSLVSVESGSYKSISVHPVIHMWMNDRMGNAQSRDAFFSAVWILGTSMRGAFDSTVASYHRRITTHIDSCLQEHEDDFIEVARTNSVLVTASQAFSTNYMRRGRMDFAAKIIARLYEAIKDSKWAEEHANTTSVMVHLPELYLRMGQYEEGVVVAERCLELTRRDLGDNHYLTHKSMANLGSLYEGIGEYKKSFHFREECFQARRRTIGDDQVCTHLSAGQLAIAYNLLGEHQKAIFLGEIAVRELKGLLGEDDENTYIPMGVLVNSYLKVGSLTQAAKLAEKCLQVYRGMLGEFHPLTLSSANSVADCYIALGRVSDAKEILEPVWDIQKTLLGEEHESTLLTMERLVRIYSKGFKPAEEVFWFGEMCIEATKRNFGDKHLHTLIAVENLADVYRELGKVDRALELTRKCWEIRSAEFGETSPRTIKLGHRIMFYEGTLLESYVEDVRYLFSTL